MTPAAHSVALAIAADHPAFAGHFPGRPLLPGVALLSEVLEAVLAEPDVRTADRIVVTGDHAAGPAADTATGPAAGAAEGDSAMRRG